MNFIDRIHIHTTQHRRIETVSFDKGGPIYPNSIDPNQRHPQNAKNNPSYKKSSYRLPDILGIETP